MHMLKGIAGPEGKFRRWLVRRREYRDHAQRASRTTGNLHRQGDHLESHIRKIVEVAKVFEHRHVMGEERNMRLKSGGLTIID